MSEPAPSVPPQPEMAEAEVYAAQALDLAVRYRTPPIPRNFEVWYTYATRQNSALNTSLERVMEDGTPIESWWIEQVYNDFLSPKGLNDGVAKISRRMDTELGGILTHLQNGMKGNSKAVAAIRQVQSRVGQATDKQVIAELGSLLNEIGSQQLKEARRLGQSLNEARNELADMQAELEELRSQAFIDHLTQLPNRRRLEAELAKALERVQTAGEQSCFALADIDKFKGINDTWGHAVGDMILMKFAQILRDGVKGKDVPARFGGEEFALLMPDTSLNDGRAVVEQVRKTFGARWFVVQQTGQEVGHVTISFGVTRIRPDDTMETLLKRADEYLYAAKENGRDQVWSSE